MQSSTPGDGETVHGFVSWLNASPVVVLLFTVVAAVSATGMFCTAVTTDHWEQLQWDHQILRAILGPRSSLTVHDKVIRLEVPGVDNWSHRNHTIFLVPMIGGIWNLCIDMTEAELKLLGPFRHSKVAPCINYLVNEGQRREDNYQGGTNVNLGSHLRMQNLAISCALVCLIILGVASMLGAFGIFQRQNSAILITGVMYLLAALFALFTSMIMLFKRQNRGGTGTDFDGTLASELTYVRPNIFQARIVHVSWGLDLSWCGVILCTITSLFWLFLSKLLRTTTPAILM